MMSPMIPTVKAALLAVGVTASTASAAITNDAPLLPDAPPPQVHHLPNPSPKMNDHALLLQIDQRLRRIEQTQETLLRGYMTGGVYR